MCYIVYSLEKTNSGEFLNNINDINKPKKPKKLIFFISGFFVGALFSVVINYAAYGIRSNSSLNKELPKNLDYSSVEELYDNLRLNYDGELDITKILDGLKYGLAKATGDPYTIYLSKEDNEEFDSDINGTFTGIGAELIEENNVVVIATPLSGFPAEKAGVKARDIILKIDGEDATQLKVSEAVKKIRGEKGTEVTLTLLRDGDQLEITITRDVISIPSVKSEIKDGIGILTIYRFGEDTARLANKYADEYVGKKVKGVVVDLRNNPGGYLDQSVSVASLWVEKNSLVVEEKRGEVSVKKDLAVGDNKLKNLPTVLLVNGGSASASEIVAGALKDYKLATIVGEKTFGKGSVQQVIDLSDGTALKVTVSSWYTPKGQNINKDGIVPDTELELTTEDIKQKNDVQLNKAIEIINKL